jgi:hypothetical protein
LAALRGPRGSPLRRRCRRGFRPYSLAVGWGRLHPSDVSSGQEVEVGMTLGHPDDGLGHSRPSLTCMGFAASLAWGRERVPGEHAPARLGLRT